MAGSTRAQRRPDWRVCTTLPSGGRARRWREALASSRPRTPPTPGLDLKSQLVEFVLFFLSPLLLAVPASAHVRPRPLCRRSLGKERPHDEGGHQEANPGEGVHSVRERSKKERNFGLFFLSPLFILMRILSKNSWCLARRFFVSFFSVPL